MYDIKNLYEATSVDDAIALLQADPEALVLAGGSDILIQMREGKHAGKSCVSIYMMDELRGVTLDADDTLRIGSLTSFSHVIKSELIQEIIPVLADAVALVGGPQVRNIGTVGGNTCNGITSADSGSTFVAWDAIVELTGPEGVRLVPIQDFYLSAGKVDLRPAELQTALLISKESYEGYFGHYIKYSMRQAMDIATLGCSVNVKLSADKTTIEDARIAFGVAGPVPMRLPTAEAAVRGEEITEELVDAFVDGALQDVNPRTSWRASKEFRLQMIQTMAERAFKEAIRKAGGDIE